MDNVSTYNEKHVRLEARKLAREWGRKVRFWELRVGGPAGVVLNVRLGDQLARKPKAAKVADVAELAHGVGIVL